MSPSLPNQFRYQLFSIFKEQYTESIKFLGVLRQTPSKAAQFIRERKAKGITLDLPDSVIAATCILHELILVTCNTKHYPISEIKFHQVPSVKS